MLYQLKESKVATNGTVLDYIAFGKGEKPLVMLQGLNTRGIRGAGFGLAYMYRIFAKDYRVYLFDRRPDIWEGITVRDFAADVAGAMDSLGISNADILGVSQGGMIGQYLAIDRPELVKKIVLAVTLSKNNDAVVDAISVWTQMAQSGNMRALVADMAERMFSADYVRKHKLFMPLLTLLQKPKDIQRFVTLAKSCLTCDTHEILDSIQCPVLVIGGKQDKVVGGNASKLIAEKLGCSIYMYDDLGHAAYEEAKDFNKRVYNFFKGA